MVAEDSVSGWPGPDGLCQMCIDVGSHVCHLRELGLTVPLFIDVTGHLVIAIDEYPPAGWPSGLSARKDGYLCSLHRRRSQPKFKSRPCQPLQTQALPTRMFMSPQTPLISPNHVMLTTTFGSSALQSICSFDTTVGQGPHSTFPTRKDRSINPWRECA